MVCCRWRNLHFACPVSRRRSGVFADIHNFPAEQESWVLLLDTTVEEAQSRLLQQKVHDFRLMQERQAYLDAISAEMRMLAAYTLDFGPTPDVARCVKAVVEVLLPEATLKNMHLQLAPALEMAKDWQVVRKIPAAIASCITWPKTLCDMGHGTPPSRSTSELTGKVCGSSSRTLEGVCQRTALEPSLRNAHRRMARRQGWAWPVFLPDHGRALGR
jgi:hypothetical protein